MPQSPCPSPHALVFMLKSPCPSPHAPVPMPQSSCPSPHAPVFTPQSPCPSPHAPVPMPQSSRPSPHALVRMPQSLRYCSRCHWNRITFPPSGSPQMSYLFPRNPPFMPSVTTVLLFWHLPLQHAWCCIDNHPVVLTSTPSTCMVLHWQSSCCSDIYPFNTHGAALTIVLLFWHLPLQHAWCCIDNHPVVLTSTPSTCMVLHWQSSSCSDIYPFNMHGAALTIIQFFWHLPLQHVWCCIDFSWSLPWFLPPQRA